uniref:RZZ complex subunit KNTC1/ROD C-terminal domain-containing protein n=1 Tax=Globodera rostochiensis TaxID=31243 RepID=A0A914IAM4_GLORO
MTEAYKMGKNRFNVIDDHFSSGDPDGNSAILTRSLDMYEVSTAKVLKGDVSVSLVEGSKEVFYACHNNWFVIAIDSDLHLFDVSVGCTEFNPDSSKGRIEYKTAKDKRLFVFPDDARVVALQFVPSTDVLLILLNNGTAFFGSPNHRLSYQYKEAFPATEKCSMNIVKNSEEFSVAISDRKGSVHFLTMPPFDAGIHDEEQFRRVFSSVQKYSCDAGQSIGAVHFIANVVHSFVFFPKRKGSTVYTSSIHSFGFSKFSPLFILKEDVQMVRTVGCFVCVLKSNGQLAVFDQNLVQIHVMSLLPKEEEGIVLDFEFLDVGEFYEFTETVKILLKVKTQQGNEFKIKQFNEVDTQFTKNCSEHAVLVPFSTPGDENNIIYIDAFPLSGSHDIFLRFVGEAQPALRLKKLIELKRFDDALAFAKSYNLPADSVYIELLLHYQEQIQNGKDGNYEEESFKELLRTLRLLTDHNIAGDHCVAVLNFVNKYEHIKTILDFAKSLKITDMYTLKEIARFRYELASYRMLFEAEGPRYGRESPWPQFLSSGSQKEFFDGFCEAGQIVEARILLSRYAHISQELQEEKSMKKLLSLFKSTVTEKPQLSGAVSEFLEVDLIPAILNSNNVTNAKTICSTFCDFFVDVSLLLERLEQKNFPQISLHFAETFDRAINLLRADCHTSDKHVTFLHILKQLDGGEKEEDGILWRLNVLIRNLKKLCKIHTVYQCAMSYSEFLGHDINSICHRIMDKIRSTASVREHIEQFVFPYVEEHGLDRNKMLHDYIKQLAISYNAGTATQAHNTWDLLCLQITEQITDVNVRCRAIIEIASGSVPPWSQQLSKVVKAVISQGDKIDPELISSLRKQCLYADLGQIFIKYEISLSTRPRVIGGAGLSSLLQFIFKNSGRDMASKLQDAFRVVELYESLQAKSMFSSVDCYYLYAVVLIQELTDENEMKSLTDLFQLIKSVQDAKSVARKLITYLKCLLKPNKIKAVISRRLIWLACLLCVAERYLPSDFATKLICDARAIRKLQTEHQIIVDFSTLHEKDKCIDYLNKFIDEPSKKSIVQVHSYGSLFCLDVKDICEAIIRVHIKNGLPDAALNTLRYLTSAVHSPTKAHLVIALDTCTFVCWMFEGSVSDECVNDDKIELSRTVVRAFQSVLPKLIDWSVSLGETRFFESFSKISRYVVLFDLVLSQCVLSNEEMPKGSESNSATDLSDTSMKSILERPKCVNKLYTVKARSGILLPHQEGTLYDSLTVVKAVSAVASSVVQPPVDDAQRPDKFQEMRESWNRLFVHLSGSHILLEIQARQFAHTLACFNSTGDDHALLGIGTHVFELCKKIFSFPVADIQLAAHLLGSLPVDVMKQTLHDLRRWVLSRKNEPQLTQQLVIWLENTQWQKRLLKQGIDMGTKQLKRDNIVDLIEANCPTSETMLNYTIELCKLSSSLAPDALRFELCIETAKAAIQSVDMNSCTVMKLMMTVQEICPYNYEAIELLFNKMQEIVADGKIESENPNLLRTKDGYMLLKFLRCTSRGKSINSSEIRWYKQFTSQKNWNTSVLSVSNTELISPDETVGAPLLDESTLCPVRQQSNLLPSNDANSVLPKAAAKKLPFHLLFNDEIDTDKFQTKLIYHELTIFNVQHWTTLIEETKSILQHSRSHLLVGSITNHVNETVKFKRELSSDDLCQIKQLTYDSPRLSILKALASRFQRLSLSQTKVSLMQLCCAVIEEWLNHFEELKLPPKDERVAYQLYSASLRELLVIIETEYLLDNNGLLNVDTVSLTQKPEELVNYLLCRKEIDWAEQDSIFHCFDVISAITKIQSVDVEGVFLALVDRWIPDGQDHTEQPFSQMASDPDSTIDFVGSHTLSSSAGGEEFDFFVPVVYDDPQTTRIIVLLRRIKDPLSKIVELSRKSEIDVSILPGGYATKIRIATCVLRFLTDEQMRDMFCISIYQFCSNLVHVLNQRLYSLCRIDIPMKDLQESEKRVEFVRSILSPQSIYRQTPEIARLLLCLIVDSDIDDLATLGKAAQRLVQLRLSRPLLELLKYLRSIKNKEIRTIPNISTFFAKTFEALFDKLDTPNARKELVSLVFFLISCPVEGEGHFARSSSLLASIGANFAASLVAICANSTAEVNLMNEKSKTSDLLGEN